MSADNERRARIADVALRLALAHGGGFDSVGLREVADEAGVALGTLYKSFRSKEDIIGAAVEFQTRKLTRQFEKRPAEGVTPLDRLRNLFSRLTHALTRRPAYARAVLGSIASNHPSILAAILKHDGEVTRIIIAAMRGRPPGEVPEGTYLESEKTIAFFLRQLWFASMAGWSGNLYEPAEVVDHVTEAARLLLAGQEATEPRPA